jgi:hypothetical protein
MGARVNRSGAEQVGKSYPRVKSGASNRERSVTRVSTTSYDQLKQTADRRRQTADGRRQMGLREASVWSWLAFFLDLVLVLRLVRADLELRADLGDGLPQRSKHILIAPAAARHENERRNLVSDDSELRLEQADERRRRALDLLPKRPRVLLRPYRDRHALDDAVNALDVGEGFVEGGEFELAGAVYWHAKLDGRRETGVRGGAALLVAVAANRAHDGQDVSRRRRAKRVATPVSRLPSPV